jgi:hypothetical protein
MKTGPIQPDVREDTAAPTQRVSCHATHFRLNSVSIDEEAVRDRMSLPENETTIKGVESASCTAPEAVGSRADRATTRFGDEPEFLTVGEVAMRLRVNRIWVYNHAALLGAYHLGKYIRFSWPKVLERLEHGL